jgi:toxin ParE1/3/4
VKLFWYFRAEEDLYRAVDYIKQRNPRTAEDAKLRLRNAVNHLQLFPEAGRRGRKFGTREVVVPEYHYIIRYRVKNDGVQILRIFHAARQWCE